MSVRKWGGGWTEEDECSDACSARNETGCLLLYRNACKSRVKESGVSQLRERVLLRSDERPSGRPSCSAPFAPRFVVGWQRTSDATRSSSHCTTTVLNPRKHTPCTHERPLACQLPSTLSYEQLPLASSFLLVTATFGSHYLPLHPSPPSPPRSLRPLQRQRALSPPPASGVSRADPSLLQPSLQLNCGHRLSRYPRLHPHLVRKPASTTASAPSR